MCALEVVTVPCAWCWQEVEPGIYSMAFGDSRVLEGRPAHAVTRHAWTDTRLLDLAAYLRPSEEPLDPDTHKAAYEQVLVLPGSEQSCAAGAMGLE